MNSVEVVGIGAMNMDQLYGVERILVDGEASVKEFSFHPGGSAANTIYGMAKLGVRTAFIGALGDDEIGEALAEDFAKVGVDVSRIRVKKGAKTGSALCLSDKQGRRSLYIMPGANSLLEIEDIDLEYINQAKILCLSSFVHESQFELQKRVIAQLNRSVKISFAPGSIYTVKGIQQIAPLLNKTYLLFINRSEMRQLTGEDFAAGAKKCLEQGCHIVVTTLGNAETKLTRKTSRATLVAHILSSEGEYLIESKVKPAAPIVDTTGAGDAFAAGFLYGFLKGKDLRQCGFLGDIMARFCISKRGAREGLPSLAELSQEYYVSFGQRL
ncbi:MAG: carbohydrate kinase family protein [Dehalococcoidia bacterium]|nr:MAG: carbohydrate kinase family protein [Dehalococcoidia bacterium]